MAIKRAQRSNEEFCAWILGKSAQVQKKPCLAATKLFVPVQENLDDSCMDTGCGIELLNLCGADGLKLIGSVHSHPTWDAFFSSKDMHMQYSIQQLLPDAVGLVMDQHHEFKTFRLTQKGMREIAKCPLSGFHPHDDADTLYEPVRVIEFKSGQ